MKLNTQSLRYFIIPVFVAITMLNYFVLILFGVDKELAQIILFIGIGLGSLQLIKDTVLSILIKDFALDYIAILAILAGILTREFLVASVIVLMLSGGDSLERYAMDRAKSSLKHLINRIPDEVNLWEEGSISKKIKINNANIGESIAIRKGEVIPLDGVLVSSSAQIDESSLTGEPYPQDKIQGSIIRSGTINLGELIVIKVTKKDKDSYYKKIIELVKLAQKDKSPFIRLADRYSGYFTIITLILAVFSYLISQDPLRILAVLVIATPCPLILATPIALIGGVNLSAKENIIIKRIQALEVLSNVNTLIFDKTGTITLGKPLLKDVKVYNNFSEDEVLKIAASIETNSLHPFAKAIVLKAKNKNLLLPNAFKISEIIGSGIQAEINNKSYKITKTKDNPSSVSLYQDSNKIADFIFEDQIKKDSIKIFKDLYNLKLKLFLFTGDSEQRAKQLVEKLSVPILIKAECTPEEKEDGIRKLKSQKLVTAMIGDGINDAPALALSDVGIVFSNEEQTAASEAADIVFLSSDIKSVWSAIKISKRTVSIAKQSIFIGIALSTVGMIFAGFGLIIPIVGAILQEAIDLGVILNSLRASRS